MLGQSPDVVGDLADPLDEAGLAEVIGPGHDPRAVPRIGVGGCQGTSTPQKQSSTISPGFVSDEIMNASSSTGLGHGWDFLSRRYLRRSHITNESRRGNSTGCCSLVCTIQMLPIAISALSPKRVKVHIRCSPNH